MPWLINAQQLDNFRKNQKNIIILDATWLGANDQQAKTNFISKHLPSARFFDLNLFVDQSSPLPNTFLRDEKKLSENLASIGLRPDSKLIFYDNSPYHSSCRAIWLLKMCGHPPQLLYLLDGGMNAWEKFEGKFESGEVTSSAKPYPVKLQTKYIRTLEDIKKNLSDPQEQFVDARHPVRFVGGKEAREGLRSGHIPGSFCFPFSSAFDAQGVFLPLEKLKKRLEGLGLDLMHPTITSCGSGMTAAVLNFILDILGNDKNALYDGSWSEWGANHLYPGEQSLSERPVEIFI